MILRPVVKPIWRPAIRSVLDVGRGSDIPLDLDWSSGVLVARISGGAVPSFSRASSATRINQAGVLETVAANVMAVDWVPALGGWAARFEEQNTNLLTYSQDFSNAAWNKSATSISQGFTDPSGGLSASKLIESTANVGHGVSQTVTGAAGQYTASFFVKAAERSWTIVQLKNSDNSVDSYAWVNLATGAVGNVSGNAPEQVVVIPLANGWWRIAVTKTLTGSASRLALVYVTTANGVVSYSGDNASGVLVFGGQLEAGGLSSYIQTTGATAVRQADTFTLPTSGWWNPAEGTFLAENGTYPGTITRARRYLWSLSDTGNSRLCARFAGGTGVSDYPNFTLGDGTTIYNLPTTTAGFPSLGLVSGAVEKLGSSYGVAGGLARWARNGVVQDAVAPYSGAAQTTLALGSSGSSNACNGYVRRLRYWPIAKTAAELAILTT